MRELYTMESNCLTLSTDPQYNIEICCQRTETFYRHPHNIPVSHIGGDYEGYLLFKSYAPAPPAEAADQTFHPPCSSASRAIFHDRDTKRDPAPLFCFFRCQRNLQIILS